MKNSLLLIVPIFSALLLAGCTDLNSDTAVPNTSPQTVDAPKAIYTLSNAVAGNQVLEYRRAGDGTLTLFNSFSTGGLGSGAGLGSQGALAFSPDRNIFFAVNPGDNSVSMLTMGTDGTLTLNNKVSSGGVDPISVTVFGNAVYVLNAGDANNPSNISGFRIDTNGLNALPNSTKALSTNLPNPAEISFNQDGSFLLVSEKGTNKIDTFPVSNSLPGNIVVNTSAGTTPFGFTFSPSHHLLVTQANGGAAAGSSLSSYTVQTTGALTPASSSVPNTQTAACWVTVAGNTAYVTNTGSNTVSSYTIGANGNLTLANANAAPTGSHPIDADVTDGNDFLYVLNGGAGSVSGYRINADGSLTAATTLTGLPTTSVGLIAR